MPRDALEAALTSQIELVQELVDERTSALDEMARLGEVLYATDNERTNLRRELDEERTRSSAESSGGGGGGVAASQVSFLRRVLAKVEASRDAARAEDGGAAHKHLAHVAHGDGLTVVSHNPQLHSTERPSLAANETKLIWLRESEFVL